jgi:hypothetical protein
MTPEEYNRKLEELYNIALTSKDVHAALEIMQLMNVEENESEAAN